MSGQAGPWPADPSEPGSQHAEAGPETEPDAKPASRRVRAVRRVRRSARPVGLFTTGVVATFLAILAYGALVPGPAPLTRTDVNNAIASALASQTPAPAYSQQVYAIIAPSVVVIQTGNSTGGSPSAIGPAPGQPAATAPAGSPAAPSAGASAGPSANPSPTASTSPGTLGSGVVIDASGDILTALHVVADASSIRVTFADGSTSPAQVVSRDPATDIAVLQASQPPSSLAPATIGNPNVAIGSQAFVVGNPFGLTGSITAGVVSGVQRSFQFPGSDQVLHGLIQVDAAVNPGNSGGPLVNRQGQVIGIVTGLINPTSQDVFIGIGLAVPINVAGGAAGLPPY